MSDLQESPLYPGNTIDAYQEEILDSLCEIIRFPSVRGSALPGKPFGEATHEALRYALDLGKRWGFKTKDVDGYAGYVEFGSSETESDMETETVAVLAHLDVVPAGQGWTHPPYEGIRDGNRIYGRGASDNKGPAIVALYGLKALRDAGYRPRRNIRVILGCSEETGMEDMVHFFSREPLPHMAFTPDVGYPAINREKGILNIRIRKEHSCEETDRGFLYRIQGGEAINMVPRECTATIDMTGLDDEQEKMIRESVGMEGRVSAVWMDGAPGRFVLQTIGKSSHGAAPELGINAVLLMTKWLETLWEEKLAMQVHGDVCPETSHGVEGREEIDRRFLRFLNETLGAGTNGKGLGIECTDAESGALTMNLGSLCHEGGSWEIALDIRYPISVDGEQIEAIICEKIKPLGAEATIIRHVPPLDFPESHPLIERLGRAYELHTGKKLELLSSGGGTYARSMKGRGIGFGGAGADAHSPDEYVYVDDLMRHARICTQAMYEISR